MLRIDLGTGKSAELLPPVLRRATESDGYRVCELDNGVVWLLGRCVAHVGWLELLPPIGTSEVLEMIRGGTAVEIFTTTPVFLVRAPGFTVSLPRIRWAADVVIALEPTWQEGAS